jgi:hypothetical protein
VAPVAFARGTPLIVSHAVVEVEGTMPDGHDLRVRAFGHSLSMDAAATTTGSAIEVKGLQTTLPNTVAIMETPGKFTWSVDIVGVGSYTVGETANRVYVTLGDPQGGRLETYYYIGCKGANGANDEAGAFAGLWSPFASRNVLKVNSTVPLKYYTNDCNTAMPGYFFANQLVEHGVGRCGAWQGLLIEVLLAQSIAGASARNIVPNLAPAALPAPCVGSPLCSPVWMMINDYNFGASTDPCNDYPHRVNHACAGIGAKWPQPDTIDGVGVHGQHNDNPPGMFLDHSIVQYNNQLYDPSYGTGPFADLTVYEASSIAGFAIPQEFNPGIPGTQLGCYFRCRQSTATLELKDR